MITAEDLVRMAKQRIVEVTPTEVADGLQGATDLVLIDVREPMEYRQGHIPGAVNIPRGVLEFQVAGHPAIAAEEASPALAHLDRPICVYCRSGARSALAALTLGEMGFTAVTSLAGGFLDWSAHRFPVRS